MDSFHFLLAVFEFVVLVFSLSVHEAAHAWTANRLGDPTARMLGRVTLNPVKHVDLIGTIVLPLFMIFMPGYSGVLVGWAKPTPVTPRNFRNLTRDDILTTLAGPCSNMLVAFIATIALVILSKTSATANSIVHMLAGRAPLDPSVIAGGGAVLPLAILFYMSVTLNVILFIFNLIPLPPLDGSHVIRHMLPYKVLRVYDSIGIIGLLVFIVLGGRVIMIFAGPLLSFLNGILLSF
ncbi:MAG TPA: site-2 protease family protein [Acidobacteriaceae bacterium]|nr:site-2 protease family protein [Acidobacteriaceae bacterium]